MRLLAWLGMGAGVWCIDAAIKNDLHPARKLRSLLNSPATVTSTAPAKAKGQPIRKI